MSLKAENFLGFGAKFKKIFKKFRKFIFIKINCTLDLKINFLISYHYLI